MDIMIAGILYSVSKAHPMISRDLLDAVKLFLQKEIKAGEVTLIPESIGLGGSEKEVFEKTERLLLIEGCDMLVAFVDLRILSFIEPLLYTSGKPVIIVNAGANIPENWVAQPNIAFLTLRHAFLCSLAGRDAAEKFKHGVLATSFYDCGYLHTASMVNRFVSGGGAISFNYINKQPYTDAFHINELTVHLQKDDSENALLCVYDELPAALLYERLAAAMAPRELSLFVSPMMLEPAAVKGLSKGSAFNLRGYMAWDPHSRNPANQEFTTSFSETYKRDPGIIALLGWELGMIINEINKNGGAEQGEKIITDLKARSFNSPRGMLIMDPDTQYFIAPVSQCNISAGSSTIQFSDPADEASEWAAFTSNPVTGVNSGWTNTYLCY